MTGIFTEILNISISASLLIAACFLIRLIFRKMPKYIRCLMWLLVFIRLAVPFSIESDYSALPTKEYIVTAGVSEEADAVNDNDVEDVVMVDVHEQSEPVKSDVMSILSIVWMIGAACTMVYAFVSFILLKRRVGDATLLRDNIYQSEKIGTSFVLGIIRPRIYVPYGLSEINLDMVLKHENAHIKRRDHLIKPLGFLIATIHWFNPAVWFAYVLLCRDIEFACDEKVIRLIGFDMKKTAIIILIFCLLSGALLYVNRDLFRYEEIFVYRRMFSPDTDHKGDYILSTEQLPLKPGSYQVTIEGTFSGIGSGFFLVDSGEEKVQSADFPAEGTITQKEFTISGSTKQVRFGISWDPSTKELNIERFIIRSEHVLYKSSLLKHAVISAFILTIGIIVLLRFISPEKYSKLFPHLSKPENERMMLMIIFLTLLTAAPFYRSDTYVNGDDFYYHMRHLKGIAASLKAGHFPVRILLDWIENFGYGSGFYYPNLLLTFPAVLILCGFHVIAAYEIFTTVCTFFSLFTMFLTVRRISGSEKAAHASSIIYSFAVYRLIDIYYRAALGEIQTFVFLPLIILGLYEIFNDHTERWWIFAAGFTGLLWCHVISLALAGVFTAIWLLFSIRKIFSDKKIFFAFIKAVLLTLGLGMWFILPMAEQSMTNELKINMIMFSPDTEPFGSSSDPRSLLLFFYDWNYVDPIRQVYPGWTFLIIPLLRIIFLRRKENQMLKLADKMTIYGFIAMIMCTNLFPWKIFIQFLYRIQFAWRIMMITTVLLSVSCAIYAALLAEKYLPDRTQFVQLLPLFILCAACGGPILIEA